MINTAGSGTIQGHTVDCQAIEAVSGEHPHAHINNSRSFIGYATGAASPLEPAGNSPSFEDYSVHTTVNLYRLNPDCPLNNVVINELKGIDKIDYILNNSCGMLGTNSMPVFKRFEK